MESSTNRFGHKNSVFVLFIIIGVLFYTLIFSICTEFVRVRGLCCRINLQLFVCCQPWEAGMIVHNLSLFTPLYAPVSQLSGRRGGLVLDSGSRGLGWSPGG